MNVPISSDFVIQLHLMDVTLSFYNLNHSYTFIHKSKIGIIRTQHTVTHSRQASAVKHRIVFSLLSQVSLYNAFKSS